MNIKRICSQASVIKVFTIFNALTCSNQKIASIDSEILLAHVLQVSRSYLHTWPERLLEANQKNEFLKLVEKRFQGEPVAYLIGHRAFWTLDLKITPAVLIPRPETELLVELALKLIPEKNAVIADLGTGSGAIALALAIERPDWQIHAVDQSAAALDVAKANAKSLNLTQVIFHQGSWCEPLANLSFTAIISNPPYIAEGDVHLAEGDLRFEPKSALMAKKEGLADLEYIIFEAKNYLKPGGYLMLEHGFDQAQAVATLLQKAGYTQSNTYFDLSGIERVTIATR